METDILIRQEQPEDYRTVEEIIREAFWNHHVPGCDEHYLMYTMRDAPSFVPKLDMVALIDDKIVGCIAYAKAVVAEDNGNEYEVLTFGPIAVLPEYQNRKIGSKLIKYTIELARNLGYKAILIYGDFEYYSKLGFIQAREYKIGTSSNKYIPSLQAYEIEKGYLKPGRFIEGEIYDIDREKSEEFDKSFCIKERKEGLDSQKRFKYLLSLIMPRDDV